ncbi:sensor histidine kinase [Oligoflexus tunisiensis]|uniref:sensor histidine kinase n=1 Tax=Oligoflexus tunisiensis TaxID=708132 RepID=UPI00114CC6C8|nr:sensor histidine kinase [Oligoflexus tunisiensis]
MILKFVLILLAAFGAAGMSQASVLNLEPETERQTVPVIEFFPEQSGSDDEVLARLAAMQGEPVTSGRVIAQAFETVWLRLVLQNASDTDLNRVLYLPNNFTARSIDFYYFHEGVFVEHKSYPQDQEETNYAIIGRSSYSTFAVPRASTLTIYLKVDTGYEALIQGFHVGTRQQFINWEVMSTFFVGIYLGILFLTAVANLMQAVAYRDRTFLWYSAYCASLMLSSLSFYGIWVRMLGMWEVQKYMAYVGGMLVLVSGSLFMRPLLNTRQLSPGLDKALIGVCWLAVLTLVLRLSPSTGHTGFALQNVSSILFMVLACSAGVNAMLHGLELAWLYTSSILLIAFTVIYVRLSQMNIVPISPNAFYAPAVGHIMQVMIISYVMFIRSRRAYSEMLRSQRNHSMNERLNLLLKIISHDIANPLQAISLYCNMALHKVKNAALPEKELEKALEAIHTQTRIIRHAKEAVRQMQLGQKMQIQPVHVSQILDEVLQIFQPLCQARGIRLDVVNELREDILVHTDPTILVHNIIGNVLSNSIKFTPQNGLIQIRVRCINRRLIFDLVDNGPGISKEKRVEIFTLNVGKGFNEQLTGAGSFGLSILQMCSELLNGQLDIGPSTVSESGQELGLRITVSLPLHHSL